MSNQPSDPSKRHWTDKIKDDPIRWVQFLYGELEEVVEFADRYGDMALLNKARAAIRRRDEDTRPSGTPGWASPYRRQNTEG